jgi:hypothetical protein
MELIKEEVSELFWFITIVALRRLILECVGGRRRRRRRSL